jgi:hypothetical protein
MLGVLFAQIVTVAHACALAVPVSQASAFIEPADESMPSDCPAMAKRVTANANVCESHCAYGQQIDVQADAPVAAIAPQPALTVCVLTSIVRPSVEKTLLQGRSSAPPLTVLFGRFLI